VKVADSKIKLSPPAASRIQGVSCAVLHNIIYFGALQKKMQTEKKTEEKRYIVKIKNSMAFDFRSVCHCLSTGKWVKVNPHLRVEQVTQ